MAPDAHSGISRPSSFTRVGVYHFLLIITVPALLLLSLVFADIFRNLGDIETLATDTNRVHLPGILASQRTLINIENMRRNVAMIYTAEDPKLRREAGIDALALAAESVFEPNSGFVEYAQAAQPRIRALLDAKKRGDEVTDTLHDNELLFSGAISRLRLRTGLLNPVSVAHSARHLSSPTDVKRDTARYEQALAALEPLRALCCQAESASVPDADLLQDCRQLNASWDTLVSSWQENVAAETEAHALWRQLDDLLRELSDDASSAEAELTYRAMEHIRAEAQSARAAFYVSSLVLLCALLIFVVAVHRFILAPIALASRDLRKIRYGLPTGSLPPVRIRELQDLLDLLPSLSQHLAELSARSGKLEKEKDRYASLSLRDALTGVHNRRSFDEHLTHENRDMPLAVLMLDVDLFKLYNDALGHQAGDAALVAVARAMERSLLRLTDKVFRYGGEEFTVLLPTATEKAALAVAERILRSVRALDLPHPTSTVAPVLTVSIGVALREPGGEPDDTELVARADKALYRAKSTGRDRVCLYRPEDEAANRP